MAHRLFKQGFPIAPKTIKELSQKFNYLLIMDFEATCEKNVILKPQEIIEFPCLALSTDDWQVKDAFHQYIKPRIHPNITPFCTDLTGIMQETVDDKPHFPKVFKEFNEWLSEGGFLRNEDTSAFVTCGDWDLKTMLPSQCELERLELPKYFEKWIDLKKTYCEATDYFPKSLKDMLVRSDIPMQGRLHSGIQDTHNMMRVILKLKQQPNTIFKITSTKISTPSS